MISILAIIILSFLAGSIPTSIIVSKLFCGFDIRERGSKNAGATNAIRVMGWKLGSIVMIVDVGKGVLATLLISQLRIDDVQMSHHLVQIIAGLSAIFGHIWTIFAGFKGGKGVGTAAGMLFALYPLAGLICLGIFLITLVSVRMVSVSSMSAAISLPIVLLILQKWFNYMTSPELLYFAIFIALLIVFTHRSNIQRILKGEENKINLKKKKSN